MTTALAGTEPLSIDPSSQRHPACFPPARLVCCHCTSPRTQVQVGASQDRAAKSRAAIPCPGLGSHPRPWTGRTWDISTLTRVTKAALSPGQLCHTAPWQCQPTLCRGGAWMFTLQGCSTICRAQRSPSSCMVVTVNWGSPQEEGAQLAYGALSRAAGILMRAASADTERLHECKRLPEWEDSAPQGLWLCPHIPTGSIPVLARAAWSLPGQGSVRGDAGIAQQHGLRYKPHSNYISQEQH